MFIKSEKIEAEIWHERFIDACYTFTNDEKANQLFTKERIFWLIQYGY
jgi:hypothetical protein